MERLDQMIMQLPCARDHPTRIGVELALDDMVRVDERDELVGTRARSVRGRPVDEVRRQIESLIVLRDAKDHRAFTITDVCAPEALDMKTVRTSAEDLVSGTVEARSEVQAVVLSIPRLYEIDVAEPYPLDEAERATPSSRGGTSRRTRPTPKA